MRTIVDPIRRAEAYHGPRTATICNGVSRTFTELAERCWRVGGLLDALGVPKGGRVALWAANSAEYLELYCGGPAAGRVIVPLNTRWAEPELAYALNDAGAEVLITDQDPGSLADVVDRVIRLDDDYDDQLTAAPPTAPPDLAEDDLAGLFYTGGTTGKSKGVMLTHRNLLANMMHTSLLTPMEAGDAYLIMAPMFHAAGTNNVLQNIAVGAKSVIVSAFHPGGVLDLIAAEEVKTTLAVPTMIAAMIEAQATDPRDTSSLRLIAHGASPIAMELVERAHELFPTAELVHLYGATETAPLVTGLRHEELLTDSPRGKAVGQAVLGVSLRIEGPDGTELPPGEPGEVVVSGPNVMKGYWNKPEQTAEVLSGGWYRTGDVGYLDDEGFLYLVDRAKDMIVSGGENVYCSEVEDVIYRHPDVLEATVFGIPHDTWGEQVHAVIVPRSSQLTEDAVIEHCRQFLAGYKVPRSVTLRSDELPKSGPGKVLKRELRAPYWEGKDRAIN
jgi:long-chain acyl-CoA synthetase